MGEQLADVSALYEGQLLRGVVPSGVVSVESVRSVSSGVVRMIYQDEAGNLGSLMVTNDDVARFADVVAGGETAHPFDADPDDFRLVAEALRIKYAALYDPMAAVNGSDVDPLPHQIRAVYEELLPRIPLRFLLADDPGAGKTIMAGLYIKELILHADCERAIVVAPGGLVEQWREELATKFDLNFEVFTLGMVDDAAGRNVFAQHPFLIVRMDQVARRADLMEQLEGASWDVAVVDEAHRMSAHYSSWAGEVKGTKRFALGQVLSRTAHNFLLMTATPHSGKEEEFQLFMSLLDEDRFEGKFRPGIHKTDTQGLMRRMVKEDLLTFEGKALFPERRAYTVAYELSPSERYLYEQVTKYVRTEMGRADKIAEAGDRKRGNNIGFALTILQRRLASSPEAIFRSLERRKMRLEERLREVQEVASLRRGADSQQAADQGQYAPSLSVTPGLTTDRRELNWFSSEGRGYGWDGAESTSDFDFLVPADFDVPEEFDIAAFDEIDEEITESERAGFEERVENVVDLATAAQTIPELQMEINSLGRLIDVAREVRSEGTDRKWNELRTILDEQLLGSHGAVTPLETSPGSADALQALSDAWPAAAHNASIDGVDFNGGSLDGDTARSASVDGSDGSAARDDGGPDGPRKIIIFTEHRDTLTYLERKISTQLGRSDAVVTIHGGTPREKRKALRERFTHDPNTVVLLATDAAGEGLNLQRAHLMVNYDLPWNPNRIEQRFGRIHRIGQREVCYLWNLVAKDTREGEVFTRLLGKIDEMNKAYNGNLFNVLGESGAFDDRSLRDLLIEAIRYGEQPEVKAKLDRVIDASVAQGLTEVVRERSLHPEMFGTLNVDAVRKRMEEARERRLQPGFVRGFFIPAFERLGGQIRRREAGRYEITHVPQRLIELARRVNRWMPLARSYERVTFELELVHPEGRPTAALLAPGHPLLGAVIEATIDDLGDALRRGTVFVDRRPEQAGGPVLLHTVEQRIKTEDGDTASHFFTYTALAEGGEVVATSAPAYLDYDRPQEEEREAVAEVLHSRWAQQNHEQEVIGYTYQVGTAPEMARLSEDIAAEAARTCNQVRERLNSEMNYWDGEAMRLREREREGTFGRIRADSAVKKSQELERRLNDRLEELARASHLHVQSPLIRGRALVIPSSMLTRQQPDEVSAFARETQAVERRAVAAALAAEQALGRIPEEMPHNNRGYDIRSHSRDGATYYLEVKGRIAGAQTFTVTANEVSFAQTQGERHRLVLVEVSPYGPFDDAVRYVTDAFSHLECSATTRSYNELWREYWEKGCGPC